MKGNEISVKELSTDAVEWLQKLHQTLTVKEYGNGTVRNYCQEMKLLFKYYNHKLVADIRQADIEQYLQYIKEVCFGKLSINSILQFLFQTGNAFRVYRTLQSVSAQAIYSSQYYE